ncbi:arginine--tRNA ligase [Candidatus Odyssella acanthamoebae]|uniref:Arginine--tRNA ligase n=1 Tax=Candidatus Odyssella acanthamoebae TaxID=91604 RepID=A0A077AYH4_9PROT|nr:arginine--tRNA ligase [Candidatus Paracaedibacter acanthamoebae]AIK95775.1 arginyl-tRNA synthetase [Candidatus Paracaedibacter acanthamoebae]
MNIFNHFHQHILSILEQLKCQGDLPAYLDFSRVVIESPKDPSHGDLATNAAMVLAKAAGTHPRSLADRICQQLSKLDHVVKVEVAGPGFINFSLAGNFWRQRLNDILQSPHIYGASDFGQGELVNVEFVSANPTGPLHTGHSRGAVFGDANASLLEKIGYKVVREYYINDAGGQTDTLARSVYLRYLQACGNTIEESRFEGLYPGEYLAKIGEMLKDTYAAKFVNAPESEWMDLFRKFTIDQMMVFIKDDLLALGVKMDVFTSERALVEAGGVTKAVEFLQEQGDIYTGILEKPKGHDVEDWEPRPQLLFRATQYGDDVDRPLQKSNGSWTYFAGDIAYHYDKYRRGFTKMIDIFGADHAGYVKRIKAAAKAVTAGKGDVDIKTTQLVNFMEKGEPVRMSKRAGTFVSLRDVVDRVGRDVARFIMLTRHQDMTIDFDFAKVVEQTKDNPVFYVQYAHARAKSVLRHGHELLGNLDFVNVDMSPLTDEAELAMIKILTQLPKQIEVAALSREPHRVANYLYEVAATFHALWNKGKDHVNLRFIDPENKNSTLSRLALVQCVATVIAEGLTVLGVDPVEEMR